MRKFIALLVAALAVPCATRAQDYGAHQFGSLILNTPLAVTSGGTGSSNPGLIGGSNITVTGTWPNQTISASASGGGTPGGISGQIQYNNAGAFGGFTVSGDGTLNTSTGALTITKAGGVAFGSAAFQPSSAFDAAGAAAAAQAASLPIGATTLPASFTASSLTSAAGGAFGTGAYAPAYVLPTATSGVLGGVRPDGTTLTNSSGAISVTYGTTAGTAAQGNDSRITGAVQTGGALGTPSSGTLTNATGFPAANLASGAIPSGATINNANWSGAGLALTNLASQATYTFLANNTAGSASPTAVTGSAALFTAMGNTVNATGGLLTYSIIGTSGATVPLLNAAATFSAAVTHSGSAAFSGAAVANAANTTTIMGGTTVPTNGANAGFLSVGGLFASAPTLSASQGAEYITAASGLLLSGYGTTYDSCLANRSGACVVGVQAGATTAIMAALKANAITNNTSAHLWDSGTAPTTLGNGTLTYSNGSAAFVIAATGGTQTITFVLIAATARWVCKATDETTLTTDVVATPTAGIVTTGVTLTAVTRSTGALTNFTASDVVSGLCRAL